MLNLDKKQRQFLTDEFGISESDIDNMTIEIWKDIRSKAFDIEADLLPDDENEPWSERCQLAVSIVDLDYSGLTK
ncbi:MAG: hypothetical protein NC253_02955 [Ruminococcus sp.]|nr:hypothetical protein [Ruminococcus sp.]MCM1380354.1 hypothetical protein [Muribaculaceae bacterium]MCM1478336.1 hypothetical protein [Muribaculaceae bacterium]